MDMEKYGEEDFWAHISSQKQCRMGESAFFSELDIYYMFSAPIDAMDTVVLSISQPFSRMEV